MIRKTISVAALCAAIIFVGITATVPLLTSSIGVFEIVARAHGKWDPTWNDDDIGSSALTAAALLLLLMVSGLIGGLISRAVNLPFRRTVWASVLATLIIAAIGGVLVTGFLSPPF